ncbi:MAG: hypothetical protein KC414_05995 [Romboutsia sp.]|nr:hypothetical protein [Romboutsia sp.]
MNKIKIFVESIKNKFTPLHKLTREVKYNPYVDNSKYFKDLIWEYRPLISIGNVSVHTTHLGSEVWELVAPELKYPIDNFYKSKIRPAFWTEGKYDLVDYQFDIFFNGILLFRLKPSI